MAGVSRDGREAEYVWGRVCKELETSNVLYMGPGGSDILRFMFDLEM